MKPSEGTEMVLPATIGRVPASGVLYVLVVANRLLTMPQHGIANVSFSATSDSCGWPLATKDQTFTRRRIEVV